MRYVVLEVGSAPAGLALGQIESLEPWERGCGHAGRPGAGVSEVWVCGSHPGVGPSQELGFKGVCLKPGFMIGRQGPPQAMGVRRHQVKLGA